VVGTWNLEYLGPGSSRGAPENSHGGPTYPARTLNDLKFIGHAIQRINFCLVVLQEVGVKDTPDGPTAAELDKLVRVLGEGWQYRVSKSGRNRHIAILFDTARVALNAVCETDFAYRQLDGNNVFDCQGFYGHATFLRDGERQNDLVVFGVHLVPGQHKTKNHDHAMKAYVREIQERRGKSECIPDGEFDVLIAGDFNASRFDHAQEHFWDDMESQGWDVLADSADEYQATRLAGVPLKPRSVLDYIIVSRGQGGLGGDEVRATTATVWSDLLGGMTPEDFRRQASDHLPVTVKIAVVADRD
jgi:endonuclease/exonuclease/phosphatase family metal-dependent hydrolase